MGYLGGLGVHAAYAVKDKLKHRCTLAIPDFDGFPSTKSYTDWNDLARKIGITTVREMIQEKLNP